MPNQGPKAVYNCTQQELYLGSENVITNCAALQADFAKHFPAYNPAHIERVRKMLNDAKDLPDFQNRDAKTEILRGKAKQKMDECLDDQRFLKAYIQMAYKKDPITLKAKKEAAGFKYYTKAIKGNAESGIKLVEESNKFLQEAENLEDLNKYMPDFFVAKFKTLSTEMLALYKQKPIAEQTKSGETIVKIKANNLLFVEVSKICYHGKLIFAKDPINYPKFVWETVVKLVGGERPTKLQGYIKDKATNLPIHGAVIESTDGVHKKITDANGRFEFAQITSGVHTFIIKIDGYKTENIEVNLETGVAKTLTILLEKI